MAIAYYKGRMGWLTYRVEKIGENQIGRLDAPDMYQIMKSDDHHAVFVNPPLPSD